MNVFDLEEHIMDCWTVVDNLRTAASLEPMNEDMIMNILLGMADLYEIKFDKLFKNYKKVLSANATSRKTISSVMDNYNPE